MTTKRQRAAVRYCESILDIKFNGDINNFNQVSSFLNEYLECAKTREEDILQCYDDYFAFN